MDKNSLAKSPKHVGFCRLAFAARHCSISEPTRCVKDKYDDTAIHPNERFFFTDTDFHTLLHPDLMKVFNYYLTRDSMQWACQRNRTYLRMVGDRFVPYAETDKMSGLIDMEYKKNSTSTTATF
ncbi:unnamed protein product, partial [Mesorhabditis spiculigera]